MKVFRKAILIAAVLPFSMSCLYGMHVKESDTLAVVGKKVITAEYFLKHYSDKLTRLGISDNGDVRLKYLINLVSDEVLIQRAKTEKLDKTSSAQKEYKRLELQQLLNAYSDKHISPAISISDSDLKQLFIKFNTRLKVSHLYAQTKKEADVLCQKLKSGRSFEELARECFSDPKLRDNGGSLGYMSVDEMDPEFENTAYSMKAGEISDPVKTVEGYSIIRLEDIKANPLVTETEFLKAKERMKTFARKRAYEGQIKLFTDSLRAQLNIKFNIPLLEKLYDNIKNMAAMSEAEYSSAFPGDINQTIATSALGKWNLKTLYNEMSIVSDKQKKWIRSKDNLEDFIAGLIMRKFISSAAVREGLNKNESFAADLAYAFDSYLLNSIENKLKLQINIVPDSIRAYYDKNIQLFTTERELRLSSILIDSESLADSIKLMLLSGADFSNLANKFSIQRLTAELGGDIGFLKKKMLGELGEDVFKLKFGEWAGPFREDDKFVFLKCTEIKQPGVRLFEECINEIKDVLTSVEWFNIRKNYMESLSPEIGVKIFAEKLNALQL